MTRPLIAVPWAKPEYIDAIQRAGGLPWKPDPSRDTPESVLNRCAAVLLPGGADVDPQHYGDRERHPTVSVDTPRDAYEIDIARGAVARDVPLVGICRGLQLLNVAMGGTLIQDIPSQYATTIDHRVKIDDAIVHTVTVTPGTLLSRVLGTDAATGPLDVNSRHHQAVKDVAPGFAVTATAPDGIVEALERPASRFCLGVQWHPENLQRLQRFESLFRALVTAAASPV